MNRSRLPIRTLAIRTLAIRSLALGLFTVTSLGTPSCGWPQRGTRGQGYPRSPSSYTTSEQASHKRDHRNIAEEDGTLSMGSPAQASAPMAPGPMSAARPQAEGGAQEWYADESLDADEGESDMGMDSYPTRRTRPDMSRERYAHVPENPFVSVEDKALSTFSTDVDTASYANVRRFLDEGQRPPRDAVRIEELVNYFDYDYPIPRGNDPIALYGELSDCPWNPDHQLLHLGLSTRKIHQDAVPPRNLVFLLDVSGSMSSRDKLPLLKRGMSMLVEDLRPEDSVAIVVYAGASGLVLPPTDGDDQDEIFEALDRLEAGGSTNGGDGIELAYRVAERNFVDDGINRVILATDGDFNVGVSSNRSLVHLIEEKRESGVFLTVLGFGRGNLQDSKMEALADHGNGNYAYIDSALEAQKVLVREAGATLVTAAKDVKVQVEFNPSHVSRYRLVGYENRMLAARDFNDDRKDAGEMGAGHTVTALYEIVPADGYQDRDRDRDRRRGRGEVDPLRYQKNPPRSQRSRGRELATFKVRYKRPDGNRSRLIEARIKNRPTRLGRTSNRFRFSAAVATFGLVLRNSRHRGDADLRLAARLAGASLGGDQDGDRAEFLDLVKLAARATD